MSVTLVGTGNSTTLSQNTGTFDGNLGHGGQTCCDCPYGGDHETDQCLDSERVCDLQHGVCRPCSWHASRPTYHQRFYPTSTPQNRSRTASTSRGLQFARRRRGAGIICSHSTSVQVFAGMRLSLLSAIHCALSLSKPLTPFFVCQKSPSE